MYVCLSKISRSYYFFFLVTFCDLFDFNAFLTANPRCTVQEHLLLISK